MPHIFFGNKKTLSPVVGYLSKMPFRKYSLGLLNTVTSAQEKYLSSTRGSIELIQAVAGGGEFSNADHLRTLSEDQRERKESQDVAYKYRLKGLVRYIKDNDKSLLLRAKSTGAWMSIRGTTVSVTVLSAT